MYSPGSLQPTEGHKVPRETELSRRTMTETKTEALTETKTKLQNQTETQTGALTETQTETQTQTEELEYIRGLFVPDEISGYICPVGGGQHQDEATADVDQTGQLHPRESCPRRAVVG